MNTAYYMATPRRASQGEPLITFNPYLETNLCGHVPPLANDACGSAPVSIPPPGVPGPEGTYWTGVNSNCMSCHRMAAWQVQSQTDGFPSTPAYRPDGLIRPDDDLFSCYTKLDFLWSLTRVAGPVENPPTPRPGCQDPPR